MSEASPPQEEVNMTFKFPPTELQMLSNRHKKFLADFEKFKNDAPMTLRSRPKEMLKRDWKRRLSAGTFSIDGYLRNTTREDEIGPDGMQTVTFIMGPKPPGQESGNLVSLPVIFGKK